MRIAGEPAVQIAEATTNEITNGSFETDLTGWTASSMVTFEQSAARSVYGKYAARCVTDAITDNIVSNTVGAADGTQTWTGSAWVYLERGDVKLTIQENNAGWTDKANATLTTTGGWYRVAVTATLSISVTDGRLKIAPSNIAASEYYVDGVQFERKGYATPFCDSSLASDGAQGVGGHAAMARTAASLRWATAGLGLSRFASTVSVYWRPATDYAISNDVVIWSDGTRVLFYRAVNDRFVFVDSGVDARSDMIARGLGASIPTASSAAQTFSGNDLLHLVVVTTTSTTALYVNGALAGTGIPTAPAWGANLYAGSSTTPDKQCNGLLSHLSIYNVARTAAQVAEMYMGGPGPYTDCIFYAPLTDSIHAEAGECFNFGFDTASKYALAGDTWAPSVPVRTQKGLESWDKPGAGIAASQYDDVPETFDVRFYNADRDERIRQAMRLGKFMDQATRASVARAKGQEAEGQFDLIFRPRDAGSIARSSVLGWRDTTLAPRQFGDLWARNIGGRGYGVLNFLRGPFWDRAERPLGNEPTTLTGSATGVAVAPDPSWVLGEVAAPALLWLYKTSATAQIERIAAAMIVDHRGDAVTSVPWLEAENETGSYTTGTSETADATANGGTRVTVNPSFTDYCLKFDGYNDYVTVPAHADFHLDVAASAAFTIRFWIYVTSYPTQNVETQILFDNVDDAGGGDLRGWRIWFSPILGVSGTAYIGSGSGAISWGNSQKPPALNQWTHVELCYSRDASNVVTRSWYTNGELTSQQVYAQGSLAAASLGVLTISTPLVSLPNYSFFKVDGIEMSNIVRHTANFTPPTANYTPDANTKLQFNCDDGTGNTLTDSSGLGHNGTLTSFGADATKWFPGIYSTLITETKMADWLVPQTMTEQYAGNLVVWARCKVASGGAVANVTARLRWQVTNGQFWSNAYNAPTVANQWEWVNMGIIKTPWARVRPGWTEEAAMATTGNRTFSLYTTQQTGADDLYVDAFIFLPDSDFYLDVNNVRMAQNTGLLIDNTGSHPLVGKTSTAYYTPVFNNEMSVNALRPPLLYPGQQAWLYVLFSQGANLNVFDDAIKVYPLRYRPRYLTIPADE